MPIIPSIDEHDAVVTALNKHDTETAAAAMSAHLQSALLGMELESGSGLPKDYLSASLR
jgi:DNA-binding GntR family transcriptional regulator